jgi:RNA polymerase sigma-70 factor (ECF subfamily)
MESRPVTRENFESVVAHYSRTVFNIAFRIVDSYEDAMDITQTTFMKAYERIDSYDPTHRVFSWLYRICTNEAINCVKRRKRWEPLDNDVPLEASPDDDVARNETNQQLQRALMTLTLDYRIVIILRHFHDLSYGEIAEILDIPEKTVKSRLFTGRQLLRKSLIKQGYVA